MGEEESLFEPGAFAGCWRSFRENAPAFVASAGREVPIAGLRAWLVPLAGAAAGTSLHVYEEAVEERGAACDQCRIVGEPALVLEARRAGRRGDGGGDERCGAGAAPPGAALSSAALD
jgi:hypothetical protein